MSDSVQPETDDFALMAQVRAGREDAFRSLVERHRRPLLNFFARMGASPHGEDLAQETFVRLWNYRHNYKPAAMFTTFLYTLARHAWLDFVRRQVRFKLFADRYREEMPVHTDGGFGRLRRDLDVQAALEKLPPKQRDVLVLAVHQGLAYDEIAAILRIPVGTVKSRVFNALAALKETFHENDA
ncbi:MAG: RNA polymerase sigma factor [Kiritimatiellia bacterium]